LAAVLGAAGRADRVDRSPVPLPGGQERVAQGDHLGAGERLDLGREPAPLVDGGGLERVGPGLGLAHVGGDPAEDGEGVDVGLGTPLAHPPGTVEPGVAP